MGIERGRLDAILRISHRHGDDWAELAPREHNSPSDHDPERDWSRGRIYECSRCQEQILVEERSPAGSDSRH